MVGPPKTLQDLRRVEGAVRVTCRTCGHVALLDREQLIGERLLHRRSCNWSIVRSELRCRAPKCDSESVRVDGVPFSENAHEVRQRRATMTLINLAVGILQAGAYPGGKPAMPPDAVRLALPVVHLHIGQSALLAQCWEILTKEPRLASETPAGALREIIQHLAERGYAVAGEYRWLM